jgi:YD repeat-containing protein
VTDTQPPPLSGTPQITLGACTASGCQFSATWSPSIDPPSNTPVPRYYYSTGSNDGTVSTPTAVTNTTSATWTLAYHASGQATGAFFCDQAEDAAKNLSAGSACNGYTIPAKPAPSPTPPAPSETIQCARRYQGTPPDASGNWAMELFNGTYSVSAKGPTTTRDVMVLQGAYSITAQWTKSGQAMQTSLPKTGVCP